MIEFNGIKYNGRHGGPFDRGMADSYYHRRGEPHYFEGGTNRSPKIEECDMTQEQIEEYHAGYDYNEKFGDKKDYR